MFRHLLLSTLFPYTTLFRSIVVVVVSAFFGTIVGAIAGYYGGWVDRFMSGYIFNVFLAFPGLLLAIALVAFLGAGDRKSTRLNSSHSSISYAVFCLKKKKTY